MGAPLVGQERLSDPDFATRPVRMMEEYLGRKFRAVMSVEIGGGNAFQPLLVAARDRSAGGRRRCHGPRLSRSADDQFRDRRAADVPADAGRHPRQRGDRRPRRELEMDGTDQPQGLHRGRLDRRHLQGARAPAPRSKRTASCTRQHRRSLSAARCARRRGVTKIRLPPRWPRRTASCCSAARSPTCSAGPPKGFCAATARIDGIDDDRGGTFRRGVPERVRRRAGATERWW